MRSGTRDAAGCRTSTREIQERFQYRDFGDRTWGAGVPQLPVRAGVDERRGPVALFDHAVTWLRRHRVLLPGGPYGG
ncbi:hypothetical protein GCM10023083_80620 [Streptomyces phyllanthi]|uniref:DUF4158 domain-containing protein n=1 Tax=Streptomyces phyllanthi TaxID=1803180 RepID=UPI0031EF61CC